MESLLNISSSAMNAQMLRMEVLSSNMANINATRTEDGGPYRRKEVLFQAVPVEQSFEDMLSGMSEKTAMGVEVSNVFEDSSPFLRKYDPGHPDAGADGYVLYPNVNVISEMINIQEASRAYQANISVVLAVKNMIAKTFEIGR
jgi:flagellar basal-body rod protein FlgC